jgi:hypothetical protein
MRNPDRIDPFLNQLGELWKKYPDLRFGQLITFILSKDEQFPPSKPAFAMFYLEENEWEELCQRI